MGPPSSHPRRGVSSTSSSKKRKKSNSLCCTLSVNSLWSVWYCTLAVAFQLYIVTASIKRFGRYIALPWPIYDQPYLELNAYVGFLGASIVMMPFFIATAVLRIGNYPNDGRKVCAQMSPARADSVVYQNVRTAGKDGQWARAVWRHGGPTAAFLHVVSAFCLLLPRVFIQAQLIKHGFLKKSELWSSELDFVISHKDRLVSLSFLSTINETELWSQELTPVASPPGASVHQPQAQLEEDSVAVSAEFVNFGVSLVVYAVRYPAVFWDSSKAFGLLFSLQLLLNGLQQLLAFTGFGVLYKVHVYGPESALVRFSPLMLDVSTTVLLFFVYNMAMTASSCTLYGYGLQKHREWVERRLQRHHITWGKESWRLWGYTPHVSAFVVLVVLACSAAPITYDFTLVYCGSLDGAVLAAVTSTVSHLFLWIVLWLFLTVKQRWKFNENAKSSKRIEKSCANTRSPTCNGHVSRGTGDSDLARLRGSRGDAPLLVIDSGQTYQIRERSCRKAILNLANRSVLRQKTSSSTDDEDIYWLKPRPPSPKERIECTEDDDDDDDDRSSTWLRNQKRSPPGSKQHKVTFEESLLNASPTRRKSSTKSPKHSMVKLKKPNVKFEDFSETASEDGDYATLTDLKAVEDCNGSQAHMSLCPLGGSEVGDLERSDVKAIGGPQHACGPEFLQRAPDTASESSTSPEKGPGSDTSSGVHSGGGSSLYGEKRSSSLENVALEISSPTWRSASLQRSPGDPATLLIFSKSSHHNTNREQFGRATNIRMTTFSENPGLTSDPVHRTLPSEVPKAFNLESLGDPSSDSQCGSASPSLASYDSRCLSNPD